MKKYFWLVAILVLTASCATRTEALSPEDHVYQEKISQILRSQKNPTEQTFDVCESVLPDIISRGDTESYRDIMNIYRRNDDSFRKSMTYNYLANLTKADENMKDSLYTLSKKAAELVETDDFDRDIEAYYDDKNLTDDELNDRIISYSAMIRDTYAQMLIGKQRYTPAVKIYDDIIQSYRSTEILINYSRALKALNRYEASLRIAIKALNMSPGSTDAVLEVKEIASLLGYSQAEIKYMVDETVFSARNVMRENLLEDIYNIPVPEFTITGLDSTIISARDLTGKVTVISFFATWCPPCRKELPHMNNLYKKYKNDSEVRFIIASTDKDEYLVRPFIEEYGYEFPVYYADGIQRDFHVKGIPSLFVIDKQGVIRYKKVGFDPDEEFEKIMTWYIEELKIGIKS